MKFFKRKKQEIRADTTETSILTFFGITGEITRGNILERYQAYEIARKNNILQIDKIRREEDFQPLDFNFLTLNLSDVLINHETMEVFTPNTGQSKNLLTGEEHAELELRSRQWIKGEHGYFAGSVSTGGGGSSGGAKAEKGLDKSEKGDIINSSDIHFDSKVRPDVQQAFKEEYLKNYNSRIIELRHADKKDGLNKMASVAQEKYKDGKWSTGNPRHAMRHEIGHAIQLEHKLNDSQWNDKMSKISGIFEKAINQIEGYKLPSQYSAKFIDEFISECVAGSYLNPKKQSKTIKEVSKIIVGE
ncbi:MAG: hypothetical protein IJ666_08125 [Ruminococcus sp.]|nr:hypothetical protein [Ruminococcus sp.]